ncbi:BadF/BadG/BcrA/BcrD ATPase family protein, partial [Acidianus sp. RZ1]
MILAVDGGATKTVALLIDENNLKVLGVGLSESSNFTAVGEQIAEENLKEAINEALRGKIPDKAIFALAGIGDSNIDTLTGKKIAERIFPFSVV